MTMKCKGNIFIFYILLKDPLCMSLDVKIKKIYI